MPRGSGLAASAGPDGPGGMGFVLDAVVVDQFHQPVGVASDISVEVVSGKPAAIAPALLEMTEQAAAAAKGVESGGLVNGTADGRVRFSAVQPFLGFLGGGADGPHPALLRFSVGGTVLGTVRVLVEVSSLPYRAGKRLSRSLRAKACDLFPPLSFVAC